MYSIRKTGAEELLHEKCFSTAALPDTIVIEVRRVPKVARNYQREDFSELLAQMRHQAAEPAPEKKPHDQEKVNRAAQVSLEKRRRDSLMSNRAMRYAYSSVEKRLHDRDCTEVSKIPDAEFEMLTEYRTDLNRCWLCGRRAIVRAGISCDDAKHMDAYMDLLRRFGAMTGELYALIVVNHAQLFDVKQDSVCIRCGEDTWMLYGDQAELSLYHNNYEVLENYERLLKPAFHLQQTGTQPHAFRFPMNLMLHYSWSEHVERFKAEALAQKQEALRARFRQVPNVLRQKRWSLLHVYYTAIDYEDKLCTYCAENKVQLKIVSAGTGQASFPILQCRVRRWDVKRFLKEAERLKEDSVKAADASYVTACEELTEALFEKAEKTSSF